MRSTSAVEKTPNARMIEHSDLRHRKEVGEGTHLADAFGSITRHLP
jgi:hypothetical protein